MHYAEALRKSDHKKEIARMDAWLSEMKNIRHETMACKEKTEARLGKEEPASVEMKPKAAHEEVPVKDAARMPVGEPRKRRRDRRHLAAQRRQKKLHKRTQSKDGCRRNLVAANRGATRRAAVARSRNILSRKETTREYCGSRKRLVTARRGTTRCAGMARRKEFSSGRVGSETTL
jgi:hypothetical protein